MAARIVVTRRIPDPALELLEQAGDVWVSPHDRPLSTAELHSALGGADAAVTLLHDRVDAAFLDAAGPGLRVVANVAVGYDNVDVAACAARGVVCTNTPGVLTDATADLAFALILASTRRLGEAERMVRAGGTWSWSMFFMLGIGPAGQDARDRRPRPDRHGHRPPRPGLRDADRLHGPAPGRRGARGRARGHAARPGRAPGDGRCRLDPLPALRRHPAPHRRPPPRPDEADRVSDQLRPGPDRLRGGAGAGAAGRDDRGRGPGRVRARAGDRAGAPRARKRRPAAASGLGHDRDANGDGRARRPQRGRRAGRPGPAHPDHLEKRGLSPSTGDSPRSAGGSPVRGEYPVPGTQYSWREAVRRSGRRPLPPCAPGCCRSIRRPTRRRARASGGRSRPSRRGRCRSGTRRHG